MYINVAFSGILMVSPAMATTDAAEAARPSICTFFAAGWRLRMLYRLNPAKMSPPGLLIYTSRVDISPSARQFFLKLCRGYFVAPP